MLTTTLTTIPRSRSHFRQQHYTTNTICRLSTDVLTEFHKKISEQPDSFENELVSLFSTPLLSEAIFVASPSLYTSFIKLEQTSTAKSRAKVLTALYKYLRL